MTTGAQTKRTHVCMHTSNAVAAPSQVMMDMAFKQQQELVERGQSERMEHVDMLARGEWVPTSGAGSAAAHEWGLCTSQVEHTCWQGLTFRSPTPPCSLPRPPWPATLQPCRPVRHHLTPHPMGQPPDGCHNGVRAVARGSASSARAL